MLRKRTNVFGMRNMWLFAKFLLICFAVLLLISATYLTMITLGGLIIGRSDASAIVYLVNLVLGTVLISSISHLYYKYSWLFIVWLCVAVLVILLVQDMTNSFHDVVLWYVFSGLVFGVLFRSAMDLFFYVIEDTRAQIFVHARKQDAVIGCIVGVLGGITLMQEFNSLWGLASAVTISAIYVLTTR